MGGEGTAGLLSLLIREAGLDTGEVGVGLLTSWGEGRGDAMERPEIQGWGQKRIEGGHQKQI